MTLLLIAQAAAPAIPADDRRNPDDWRGEWGAYEAEPGEPRESETYYAGGGISIHDCDAAAMTCKVELDGRRRHNNEQCVLVSGRNVSELTLISADTAQAEATKLASGKVCKLMLRRDAAGPAPSLAATLVGGDCYELCRDATLIRASYPRRTASRYPVGQVFPCFADQSAAAQAACTDPALHDAEQALAELTLKTSILQGGLKLDHTTWRRDMLAACDKAADPGQCVRTQYESRRAFVAGEGDHVLRELKARRDALGGAADPARASAALAAIAGVYKERFENGLIDGATYPSENVLEIVPIGGDAAYFKTRIEAYNGHSCGIFGIVRYRQSGALVFDDAQEDLTGKCLMQIKADAGGLTLVDDETFPCRNTHCGARGVLDGQSFKAKHRRTIRYMQRLKDSDDYKRSLAAFKAGGG
jgi:hypothetical protein